jgi:ParB-like chromosome segregation protein Spo0J
MSQTNPQTMKKHKFNIFPEAKEEDFKELLEDIRTNGFDESMPIITYQGDILDGWNRWRACEMLGIKPTTIDFEHGDSQALAYTLRTNKRRNMPSGQKAALAVEAEAIMEELRKEAEREANRKRSEAATAQRAGQDKNLSEPKNEHANKTATRAAELFGTNRTYVQAAAKIKAEAPEVFEKLKAGKTTMQEARKEAARKPTSEEWLQDELDRKAKAESGETVVANFQRDKHLIQWAGQNGKMVAIDRTSKWGNPFILGQDGDRDRVCDCFEKHYALNKDSFSDAADELKGKVLCCHCYPQRCHGDSLISLFLNK